MVIASTRYWCLVHRDTKSVVGVTPREAAVPGYPLFIAGIYAVFGQQNTAVRIAQSLIDLLTSDESGPLAELQGQERKEWVRESVARLPEALGQTLILAYHEDLKYREIAEILKIPVGTVKSRLHAALAKLQQMAKAANRDGIG